jgi:glycerol-3-phosphate dehydrogenase subunit C
MMQAKRSLRVANSAAPAYGKRKVVLFATCLVNWNKPEIGLSSLDVLTHNGVETVVSFPGCCGMPQLEHGNVKDVVARALKVAPQLLKYVEQGYAVVTPVPSCTFMLKQEWPSLLPNDEGIKKLATNTFDISEYIVLLSKKEGVMKDLSEVSEKVTLQHACHARSQNMGFKVTIMIFIPILKRVLTLDVTLVERDACAGTKA